MSYLWNEIGMTYIQPTNPPTEFFYGVRQTNWLQFRDFQVYRERFRNDLYPASAVDSSKIDAILGSRSKSQKWMVIWIHLHVNYWKLSKSLNRFIELLKHFDSEGYNIHIVTGENDWYGNPVQDLNHRAIKLAGYRWLLGSKNLKGECVADYIKRFSVNWVPVSANTEANVKSWNTAVSSLVHEYQNDDAETIENYIWVDSSWQDSVWGVSTCTGASPSIFGYTSTSMDKSDTGADGVVMESYFQAVCTFAAARVALVDEAGYSLTDLIFCSDIQSFDMLTTGCGNTLLCPDGEDYEIQYSATGVCRNQNELQRGSLGSILLVDVINVYFWTYCDWEAQAYCGGVYPLIGEKKDFAFVRPDASYSFVPKKNIVTPAMNRVITTYFQGFEAGTKPSDWSQTGGTWSISTDGHSGNYSIQQSAVNDQGIKYIYYKNNVYYLNFKTTLWMKYYDTDDKQPMFVFRYQDINNFYYLGIMAKWNKLSFRKVIGGVDNLISEIDFTTSSNVWYGFKVVVDVDDFFAWVIDSKYQAFNVAGDTSITSSGRIGVGTAGWSQGRFDDIYIVSF